MKERLQKLIAAAGLASRRATLGESGDPARDRIEVDGRPLRSGQAKIVLMLNKPSGYVTTARDPQGRKIVTDLVRDVPGRFFPVGRLDINTEGLLLMTNDGDLAAVLSHPRHQVSKTYLVRVRGHLSEGERLRLERGINLEDGPTAPAKIEKVRFSGSHTWFEITIHEGRNRQVRRMCEAVGHPVSRLKRIRLAFLELGDLSSGKHRRLTPGEVKGLKRLN
jgi:23S rRNA pseudouridine2605 synthase